MNVDQTNLKPDLEMRLEFELMASDMSRRFIGLPPDTVVENIRKGLEELVDFFGVDRSTFNLIPDVDQDVDTIYTFADDGIEPLTWSTMRDNAPWIYDLLSRGQFVKLNRMPDELPEEAEVERRYCLRSGIKSYLGIPVVVGRSVKYAINFGSFREYKEWPDALVPRLRCVGEIFANAMERMRADVYRRRAFDEIQHLKDQLQEEVTYFNEEIELVFNHDEFIGDSKAIRKVLALAERVAGTGSTVLVQGETGTGKELLARVIHKMSPRREHPMIKVNCAALPATLVESELFGREKGAYTGALTSQMGRFQVADGSTIFLDEIGELPLELQAKLLHVLQDGRIERLGSTQTIQVDARIITATNKELAREVQDGNFREDLFYRLNVFPVTMPPLRERPDDIPPLVQAFVRYFNEGMGKRIEKISQKSIEALQRYPWPGNVRELRNVIEHAMILCTGKILRVEEPSRTLPSAGCAVSLEEVERTHILKILEQTGWRVRGTNGAAEILDLKPTTLHSRMQKLGIKRPD